MALTERITGPIPGTTVAPVTTDRPTLTTAAGFAGAPYAGQPFAGQNPTGSLAATVAVAPATVAGSLSAARPLTKTTPVAGTATVSASLGVPVRMSAATTGSNQILPADSDFETTGFTWAKQGTTTSNFGRIPSTTTSSRRGLWSLSWSTGGTAQPGGAIALPQIITVVPGQGVTYQLSVKGVPGGRQLQMRLDWALSGTPVSSTSGPVVTFASGVYQDLSLTAVVPAGVNQVTLALVTVLGATAENYNLDLVGLSTGASSGGTGWVTGTPTFRKTMTNSGTAGRATVTSSLKVARPLAAASAGAATATATLGKRVPLASTAAGAATVAAIFAGPSSYGNTAGQAAVAGALVVAHTLAGQSAGRAAPSAALKALRPLAGSVVTGRAVVTVTLGNRRPLAATVAGRATAASSVVTARKLTASLHGVATVVASERIRWALAATVAGVGVAGATSAVLIPVTGRADGTASTLGAVGVAHTQALAGLSQGAADSFNALAVTRALAGVIHAGTVHIAMESTGSIGLEGFITATGSVGAALKAARTLTGAMAGHASVTLVLTRIAGLRAQLAGQGGVGTVATFGRGLTGAADGHTTLTLAFNVAVIRFTGAAAGIGNVSVVFTHYVGITSFIEGIATTLGDVLRTAGLASRLGGTATSRGLLGLLPALMGWSNGTSAVLLTLLIDRGLLGELAGLADVLAGLGYWQDLTAQTDGAAVVPSAQLHLFTLPEFLAQLVDLQLSAAEAVITTWADTARITTATEERTTVSAATYVEVV